MCYWINEPDILAVKTQSHKALLIVERQGQPIIVFVGDENSSVTGRIRGDGSFDGCFYTAGTLYHLEPASRYFTHPLPFHSLVYQSRDVIFDSSLRIAAKKVYHSYRKLHYLPKTTSFKVIFCVFSSPKPVH